MINIINLQENTTAQIMPKNTVYVSVIKEPASMFESMYNWVNLPQRYKVSLGGFLESPRKYYFNYTDRSFARNPMMFDFGLEPEDFEHTDEINAKIEEIDRRFSLIMLAEYMDESLVLLRKLLCWSWDDVVVFRVNARKSQYKENLSDETRGKICRWNSADTKFYEHFSKRFHQQMKEYGPEKLQDDVRKLRNLTDAWYNFCVEKEISKNDTTDLRFQVWHPTVNGFLLSKAGLKNATCVRLAMAENPFTDDLRMKLWPVQTTKMLEAKKAAAKALAEKAKTTKAKKGDFW